jgi:hypothetical protein
MFNDADQLLTRFRNDPFSKSPDERISSDQLRLVFGEALPDVMLKEYKVASKYLVRVRCVWISTGYCRRSDAAVELGKLALFDKSKVVRYRARVLLACSLKCDAIPDVKQAIERTHDEKERLELLAVLDAIENQNHTYFWDLEHRGKFIVNFEAPILS